MELALDWDRDEGFEVVMVAFECLWYCLSFVKKLLQRKGFSFEAVVIAKGPIYLYLLGLHDSIHESDICIEEVMLDQRD